MDMMQNQMQSYFDLHGLDKMRQGAQKDAKGTLRQVANQFESIFMRQMLKSMRDASFGDPLLDSNATGFYRDMHDDQLAMDLSKKGSIGLADMIVRQLEPALAGNPSPDTTKRFYEIQSGPMSIHNSRTNEPLPIKRQQFFPIQREKIAAAPMQLAHRMPTLQAHEFDGTPDTFIRKLLPYAEKAAASLGVDARALVAQAGLETGWGKAMVTRADGKPSNNLFNIKADHRWDGDRMWKETLEFDTSGLPGKKKAAFRAYDSLEASFADYVTFLKASPRYDNAMRHAGDSTRFVEELQNAGYATDPDYATKIKRIIEREPLLRSAQG